MNDTYRGVAPAQLGPANLSPAQRGEFNAAQQFLENQKREFEGAVAAVRSSAVERDVRQATRDRYDRAYERCRQGAERLAGILGHPIAMPAYLPAPTSATEVLVDVPPHDSGAYAEHGSPALPPVGVPGSADDWLARDEKLAAPAKRVAK